MQVVPLAHRAGRQPLQQLSQSRLHGHEPDAPQPVVHDAQADDARDEPVHVSRSRNLDQLLARVPGSLARPPASTHRQRRAVPAGSRRASDRSDRSAGCPARQSGGPRRCAERAADRRAANLADDDVLRRRRAPAAAPPTPAPGATPTRTVWPPLAGNAIAMATDMTIGKRNVQNSASGSRTNSRSRASVSSTAGGWLREAISGHVVSPIPLARCRPVSAMNTSSSVPWWTTTFGAPSEAISALRRVLARSRGRGRRSPPGRTASRPRPCSGSSAPPSRRLRGNASRMLQS